MTQRLTPFEKATKTTGRLWHDAWFSFFDTFSRRGGFAGEFEGRAYHLKPIPFALSQSASGVIPLLLFLRQAPAHLRSLALYLLVFKVSIGAFLAAYIAARFCPIIINERGLRARNFFGEARRVAWDDIERVAPIRWLFVAPMLRISTRRRRNVIWLPLYLEQQAEFEAQVAELTPEGHPMRRFFGL